MATTEQEQSSVTVTLSDEAYQALKEIAEIRGISLGEALKFALSSELFILRAARDGSKILIQKPDDSVQRYVLSDA